MSITLPYLVTPGSVKNALDKIRSAMTPDRVTGDFVSTVLQVKGGTGKALLPYLKKIGFVASDGTPTDIYKRFRNPNSSGSAAADAVKTGYRDLTVGNEYFYKLSDKDLLALIVQVTGVETGNSVAKLTLSTLRNLISFAKFEGGSQAEIAKQGESFGPNSGHETKPPSRQEGEGRLGLNLSYTINLNLPATTDQAVFNAIFRSLKEHLLSNED